MNDKFLIYKTEDDLVEVNVRFDAEAETVWLSLDKMSDLFDRDKSTISRHIKNIFEEAELSPDSTVAYFATVQEIYAIIRKHLHSQWTLCQIKCR